MLDRRIKVLIVEDNAADAEFVKETLSDFANVEYLCVGLMSELIDIIKRRRIDIILLDLRLPDAEGLPIISTLQEICPEKPIVVLTGVEEEEMATEAVRLGAEDYLLKKEITPKLLHRSINYAIERKRTREMASQLVLMKQREDFIATLTHDLKNPLIGADQMLVLLINGKLGELTEKQQEVIALLQRSNREQLDLIQQLLEVYRYEAGVQALTFQNVDITRLISDCLAEVNPVAESRELKIDRALAEDLKTIWADGNAIRRVVKNLLINAIKFSPQGGLIEVVGRREDGLVEFSVKDEGVGIPASELTMLFQRFVQGSAGRSHLPGTGLGLYLSRKIVEAHGGRIDCVSEEGKGSTFIVRLPSIRAVA